MFLENIVKKNILTNNTIYDRFRILIPPINELRELKNKIINIRTLN